MLSFYVLASLSVQKRRNRVTVYLHLKSEDMSDGKTDSDFSSVKQLQIVFFSGEANGAAIVVCL